MKNWKLKGNETPPTHNNRSLGFGGVWCQSIHQDAMSGNSEAVKQHLAKGVDVDSKDENG